MAGFLIGCLTLTTMAVRAADESDEAAAAHGAKISLQKAAKIALKSFTITQAELEQEHGRLVWSFDIAAPKSKQIIEMQVDAKTGKIVSVEIEGAEEENEKAEHAEQEGEERADGGEQRVDLEDLTPAARARVRALLPLDGGKIEKLTKENENGREVYDVEGNAKGKHVEYTIGTDGAVLGTETAIAFQELPETVRAAAKKYFGATEGLSASKGLEGGKTTYEIAGRRNGKKAEVTFDPEGKVLEEE